MINRLRDVMTSVFPTLEQQFDYSSHKGALILLTEYASPKRLRRLGETRLTQWLRRRQVRDTACVAARALAAAHGQDIELPGQQVAERGYRNPAHYQARILLISAARRAA
jgi:hypothetical protein